jgi:hypothetical protein
MPWWNAALLPDYDTRTWAGAVMRRDGVNNATTRLHRDVVGVAAGGAGAASSEVIE